MPPSKFSTSIARIEVIWLSVVADIRLKGFGCFELVRACGKLNQGGAKGPTHCKISPFTLGCTNLGPLVGCSLARMPLKGHKKRPRRVKLQKKPGPKAGNIY